MIAAAWLWLERRLGGGGAALLALVLLILLLWVGDHAWGRFKTWYWRSEAQSLEAIAGTAQANADSANAGAANATRTRATMGAAVGAIHARTEDAARRVETHEDLPDDAADGGPLDAASLRELEAAHDRTRAAADRLRGTR